MVLGIGLINMETVVLGHPQLTGRRVVRIINHSQLILSKASAQQKKIFFKLLGQQTNFFIFTI